METKTFLQRLAGAGYTGIDVSLEISLLEYGWLYNPDTCYAIYAQPLTDCPESLDEVNLYHSRFDRDDIRDAVDNIRGEGFWEYIGNSREDYLSWIRPDTAVLVIHDIDSYNGGFSEIFIGCPAESPEYILDCAKA